MSGKAFDRDELQKLNHKRPSAELPREPDNGVSTPSPERIKEAVREANDPKRLISDPQNYVPARR
jgi:hypothetical protein